MHVHPTSILLFGISANIDNLTVGIAYGIRKMRITLLSNLLIALVSGIGTYLSMRIGLELSRFLSAGTANLIGSILLILLGVWTAKDFFFRTGEKRRPPEIRRFGGAILEKPELLDKNRSETLDAKEAVALAFALTVNNFGLGVGASVTGLNIYATVLCTFVFSIGMLTAGCLLGRTCLSKSLGKLAPLISGAVIVALGICELCV